MNSARREPLSRRWLLTVGAFISAYLFAFAVTAAIRTLHLPGSDATWIALTFGIPCVAAFALFERRCFAGYPALARIPISGILSFLFAAATFWLALITAWGLLGGGAGL